MELFDYNERNAHIRDKDITFNPEGHIYTAKGIEMISVTTFISTFFEQFDADYWAERKAPMMGLTPEQLKAQWKQKSTKVRAEGTQMHASIENYYKGMPIEQIPADIRPLFQQFIDNYDLQPYRTEWAIYDEESRIAGTLDFLELKDGVFTIFDWKRSEKLIYDGVPDKVNRFGKTAKSPINYIDDTSYWHYALQLSMYRYILEKNYDINVQKCCLGVFHPNLHIPYVIDTPYLKKEVIAIMNTRK